MGNAFTLTLTLTLTPHPHPTPHPIQVRQVMPSGRFYVCVNSDEDFIESYQPEDEYKEWRRTGHVGDISAREITKVEVRELLVKLRGYSYLRSKWLSVAEIET